MPRRGRRRREGTRWFADIHATPQAYHAGPDAVIHRSAWNIFSANFACTEFREVGEEKLHLILQLSDAQRPRAAKAGAATLRALPMRR